MASASRFRRLPPPRLESREHPASAPVRLTGRSGDLFEHFGVADAHELPSTIVAAAPCPICGWLRRADAVDPGCPVCAAEP